MTKLITVRGIAGEKTARCAMGVWLDMNPLQRVMFLHDECRDVLQGQRFDIIAESRAA